MGEAEKFVEGASATEIPTFTPMSQMTFSSETTFFDWNFNHWIV